MFARLRSFARRVRSEIEIYRLVASHPRTPRRAKWLLGLAIGYMLSPVDIIPDFVPIVGHLDDVLIVPFLVWLALRSVPRDVLTDCRRRAVSS